MRLSREQLENWHRELDTLGTSTAQQGIETSAVIEILARASAALSSRMDNAGVSGEVPVGTYQRRSIDTIPIASLITDPSGIILRANSVAQQYLGTADLVGLPTVVFIAGDERRTFLTKWEETVQASPRQWHVTVMPLGRMACQVLLTVDVIRDDQAKISGMVCRFGPS